MYFGRKVLNQQGQILYIAKVQLMHFVKMSASDVTNLEKKLQGGQDFGFNDIEKPGKVSNTSFAVSS